MTEKKSPIKDKPLREPGQSVNERIQEILYDKVLSYYLIAGLLCTLAVVEWIKSWTKSPPLPWFYTVVAILASAYAGYRIRGEIGRIRNFKLGRDGERAVGQFLDRLVANGYRVYHDIPGDGWNIDHVIISTRGIFAIETKTRSKPSIGESLINFNGKSVAVDGGPEDERPIRQSLAQSKQLQTMLKEWTGYDFAVQGVVLYPGWYVHQDSKEKSTGVWVLNPKALHKWIQTKDEAIPVDRVKQAATALAKYVRAAA
jgi:hypothetical protein